MINNYGPLGKKTFSFAMKIVTLQKHLQADKREYALSKQLFEAGTSTGILIRQSFAAQSDREFLQKFYAAKEHCLQSIYWLDLLYQSNLIEKQEFQNLNKLALEIIKLISSSIRTKKKNIRK